jgi:hypothetical protein
MTDLSPAAQSVLDAANLVFSQAGTTAQGIAAALRAAADQLINVEWSVEMWEVHQEFHAIATELEGHQ